MKKIQYISPACEVINVNVQSRFLMFSQDKTVNGTDYSGTSQIGTSDGDNELDVKGEGNFWDEW